MVFRRAAKLLAVMVLCVAFLLGGSAQSGKLVARGQSIGVVLSCDFPCHI
jgi:hypothetical protein